MKQANNKPEAADNAFAPRRNLRGSQSANKRPIYRLVLAIGVADQIRQWQRLSNRGFFAIGESMSVGVPEGVR